MSRSLKAAIAFCLLAPIAAVAGPYSDLYVFGDSLSDGGSDRNLSVALNNVSGGAFPIIPAPNVSPFGRFGNGLVAVDYLANALQLPLTAHYVTPPFLGGVTAGNNYAQGGATSGTTNASAPSTITLGAQTVATGFNGTTAQILDYTSTHAAADPNALYVVWSGANDFIHFGAAGTAAGCANANPAVAAVCTAVTNITNGVAALAALGAHHIVVPNLPDLGATAQSIADGPAAIGQAHALTLAFNAALAQRLGTLSTVYAGSIVPFDFYGVFNDILADPLRYGFTNATMSCLNGSVADASSSVTAACAVAGPDHYIFWDPIHPTAAAQAIVGQRLAVAVGVPEPSAAWLLALGVMLLGVVRRDAWRSRIRLRWSALRTG